MERLKTVLCGLQLASPVLAASGTFGDGFAPYVNLSRVGAIVLKGVTKHPRRGNDGVRLAEPPAGLLNCIGLENPGLDAFLATTLPKYAKLPTTLIANISGDSVEEYGELAARLEAEPLIAAIEVNLSCPNVASGGMVFGTDPNLVWQVTATVKQQTRKPVIVKLTPNVTDIVQLALSAQSAGADALSLINTVLGMAIDVDTRRPVLGHITGGLSGAAIRPIALQMVWRVAQAVSVPIIGGGGIMTGRDAAAFLLAGASAVSVGTASFYDPAAINKITDGLRSYMIANRVEHVSALVGQLRID